jgi:hypothetical protein
VPRQVDEARIDADDELGAGEKARAPAVSAAVERGLRSRRQRRSLRARSAKSPHGSSSEYPRAQTPRSTRASSWATACPARLVACRSTT